MPVASETRPTFGHIDADAVVVTTASLPNQDGTQVAEDIVTRWESSEWPPELLSLSAFVSNEGTSLLTYAQWSSESALQESLRDISGLSWAGVSLASATETTGPLAFRLYLKVEGSTEGAEHPPPVSFPVAFFTMPDHDTATRWVDDLLSAEVESEGEERAYPGAIAANFHVSIDGTRVLVLSEWLSDEAAKAHIEAVWEPILEHFGGDAGARYRHVVTLTRQERPAR